MTAISEFMKKIGCEKYPERWNDFFDEVATDVEKNGCKFATPEYLYLLLLLPVVTGLFIYSNYRRRKNINYFVHKVDNAKVLRCRTT